MEYEEKLANLVWGPPAVVLNEEFDQSAQEGDDVLIASARQHAQGDRG